MTFVPPAPSKGARHGLTARNRERFDADLRAFAKS